MQERKTLTILIFSAIVLFTAVFLTAAVIRLQEKQSVSMRALSVNAGNPSAPFDFLSAAGQEKESAQNHRRESSATAISRTERAAGTIKATKYSGNLSHQFDLSLASGLRQNKRSASESKKKEAVRLTLPADVRRQIDEADEEILQRALDLAVLQYTEAEIPTPQTGLAAAAADNVELAPVPTPEPAPEPTPEPTPAPTPEAQLPESVQPSPFAAQQPLGQDPADWQNQGQGNAYLANVINSSFSTPGSTAAAEANFQIVASLLQRNGNANYLSFNDNGDGTITVDGSVLAVSQVYNWNSTCYDGYECAKLSDFAYGDCNPTASGILAQRGLIACNDLPMGAVVFVEDYGLAVVADRHVMGSGFIDLSYDAHEIENGIGLATARRNVYLISIP